MRKNIFVLVLMVICFVTLNVVYADDLSIKEISEKNTELRNTEVFVTGEITSITYRETTNVHMVNTNKSQSKKNDKNKFETNIYYVSDENGGIYILTLKHFNKKEKVTFKTNILMNSSEQVGNDQAILYDKYIAAKTGISSLGYSQFNLEMLIKEIKEKPWVLLIDIE